METVSGTVVPGEGSGKMSAAAAQRLKPNSSRGLSALEALRPQKSWFNPQVRVAPAETW